jgi:hypothetical protein
LGRPRFDNQAGAVVDRFEEKSAAQVETNFYREIAGLRTKGHDPEAVCQLWQEIMNQHYVQSAVKRG